MDHGTQQSRPSPLSGYRVLDLGWVLAGAIPGMVLADMGAEVIKVETHQRMDYMRLGRPIVGDEPDPEQNPMFHNVNRSKLSISVNTNKPQAIDLLKQLVVHCDVVIENFSPGVLDKIGLSYDVIKGLKPEIIMISLSANGQTGPLRDLRAYAPSIGALSGLDSTIGYGDAKSQGRPLGMKHAYADVCAALHGVFAVVSALYRRKQVGEGQYIDLSMLRATVATMGVGLMEYEMTGRVMGPQGNYDPVMAPYGHFPCSGDDSWLSVAVHTDDEWQGLKQAMGDPDWAGQPEFASRYARLQHRQELEAHVGRWTAERNAGEVANLLQSHGVPAFPVSGAEDRLFSDHFRERGLYSDIEHPRLGTEPIFNIMWNLSETPPSIRRHAPLLGEHNKQVFGGLLGLSADEIGRLEAEQILW